MTGSSATCVVVELQFDFTFWSLVHLLNVILMERLDLYS